MSVPGWVNVIIDARKDVLTLIFDKILGYDNELKNYYLNDFEFKSYVTPFASFEWPLITVLLYCIIIPSLKRFMENRKSPPIKLLLIIHNLFLSLISAFVAFLLITILIEFSYVNKYDYMHIYCNLNFYDQKGLLTLLYYINYLLKYYELIDTIFLCLKHRKISFLHGYHHPATLVLTWGQLYDSTGMIYIYIILHAILGYIVIYICIYL